MKNVVKSAALVTAAGWTICIIGWILLFSSIWFALPAAGYGPRQALLYRISLAVLAVVALAYTIARLVSERWRSKAVRFYFSPYLIGATCWLILFLAAFIVAGS